MAQVTLEKVAKTFGRLEVVHPLDLTIGDGEFVVIVGPSGCGKSTLLRLIAGLEDVTSGELFIDGTRVTELPPKARGVAMVFQSYALYPHMSVFQNMAFGLEVGRVSRDEIRRRVERAAGMLQITSLLDRRPRELSGGQRQRVAIGRAIVRDPKVFLFDEPLSNLDAALRVQTRIEIARLHSETRATMVYVTHDQTEAMTLADRIVVLNAGRIEQVGAPLDLYHRPANRFVAGFLGSPQMNFLAARPTSAGTDALRLELPGGAVLVCPPAAARIEPDLEMTLGIRPEHVGIGDAGDAEAANDAVLSGKVEVIEELGESHLLHVRIGTGELVAARGAGAAAAGEGGTVRLTIPAAFVHLFDRSGRAIPLAMRDRDRQG